MKQKIVLNFFLVLMVCFGFQNIYGQEAPVKIVYKNGTILNGTGRLASKNRIKFSIHPEIKAKKISFDLIDYALIGGKRYEQHAVKDKKKKIVAEVKVAGAVWLYEVSTSGYNPGFTAGGSGNAALGGYHYNINNFYVKNEGDSEVIHLGSNQLFTKNFKQGASEFFKSCPELVEKIQNREFKKKDIVNIARYFNFNCK